MPHTEKPIYSNSAVLAPDGELIFYAARKRAIWYVERNLAETVQEDPLVVRLLFEPKGRGHAGDPYYLAEKINACVVCGSDHQLNKHHIVPRVYRKHFPDNHKNRSSHDIVATCTTCHEKYEVEALRLKKEIAAEVGYLGPLTLGDAIFVNKPHIVFKKAATLLRYRDKMPQSKIDWLTEAVKDHLGRDFDDSDLEKLVEGTPSKNPLIQDFGKYTVDRVDLKEFIFRWRRHFIECMKPQFMPEGWDVERPIS